MREMSKGSGRERVCSECGRMVEPYSCPYTAGRARNVALQGRQASHQPMRIDWENVTMTFAIDVVSMALQDLTLLSGSHKSFQSHIPHSVIM